MSKLNGFAKSPEALIELVEVPVAAAETPAVVVPEIVPAAVVTPPVVAGPRTLNLVEKIQRVEDLTLLIERWRTLTESRRKLQTFQIGADSLSSTILLRDASGNEFKTSNSAVITSVINEMKITLDSKVSDCENQINF